MSDIIEKRVFLPLSSTPKALHVEDFQPSPEKKKDKEKTESSKYNSHKYFVFSAFVMSVMIFQLMYGHVK